MNLVLFSLFLITISSIVQGGWINDPETRKFAEQKTPVRPTEFVVDLDLPQEQRWTQVGSYYADRSWMLVNYLRENLPDGWLKPLEKVAAQLLPFFKDYKDEMKGYASALKISEGDVVMINLVYQLERLGISCDNWNTTGPVNPSLCIRNEDGYGDLKIWPSNDDGPGMCTSFTANNKDGTVYHGRNLDWNLEDTLKQFIINVQFTRGGKNLFKGTTVAGFVGLIHAVKPGAFGWSLNARRKGGSIPLNLLAATLINGTRTPEQHARYVFENAADYDEAVQMLGNWPIVNDAYFTVSGATAGQGVVLARDREGVAHAWHVADMPVTPDNGESGRLVQERHRTGVTNYDLQVPVPPSDDRSAPMTHALNSLKGTNFDATAVWGILKTWPTMNLHTDISLVSDVKQGTYDVWVWMDHKI